MVILLDAGADVNLCVRERSVCRGKYKNALQAAKVGVNSEKIVPLLLDAGAVESCCRAGPEPCPHGVDEYVLVELLTSNARSDLTRAFGQVRDMYCFTSRRTQVSKE